jgi:hypothetical protein
VKPLAGPSNRALLDALAAGLIPFGHVLVRRDGRIVDVAEAREDDWLDLLTQLDAEPIGPAFMHLIEGQK